MNKKITDQINRASLDLRLAAFRNNIEEIIYPGSTTKRFL